MSINISAALASVSDVTVTVHMNRLTKGQRASVMRQVESGVVRDTAMTSVIAKHILASNNLPHVAIKTYGYIYLVDVPLDPTHPLREALATAEAVSCMINPERQQSWNARSIPMKQARDGWFWLDKSARDAAFKNVSCKNVVEIPEVFNLTMI